MIGYQKIEQLSNIKRLIGENPLKNTKKGPVLLISAGIHGNEPTGILGLKRVFEKLEEYKIPLKGRVMGVAGNIKALKKGVRMIDQDLNRICTLERAAHLEKNADYGFSEESEFSELLQIIKSIKSDPFYTDLKFIDLHTTSSPTIPYISVNRKEDSYRFAKSFPVPVVSGIEQFIPGHFDHYLSELGHVGFTLEAGQHKDMNSVDRHEAIIWLTLQKSGLLRNVENYFVEKSLTILQNASDGKAGNYEVIYKYNIMEGEEFKMASGFKNFQEVQEGELLAISDGLPLYAEKNSFIFLPLYQDQGSDGFFLIKKCN